MDNEKREKYKNINYDRAYLYRVAGFGGLDGWNRYGVLGDGTILISQSHAIGSCAEVAESLGVIVDL